MVDPKTRRRRRVSFPNAPPKRSRGPSAGTVGDSQRRTTGMGHSANLLCLRVSRAQTSNFLEVEGRLLNLLQGDRHPPTPLRTRQLALNQFVGVPGRYRVAKWLSQCVDVSKSIAAIFHKHPRGFCVHRNIPHGWSFLHRTHQIRRQSELAQEPPLVIESIVEHKDRLVRPLLEILKFLPLYFRDSRVRECTNQPLGEVSEVQ